ncbi:MAG: MOSC domain-containing protein [Planctomycetaceae bacterium]
MSVEQPPDSQPNRSLEPKSGTLVGRLEWIGLRPIRKEPVQVVTHAEVMVGRGLVGDHYTYRRGAVREITLLQWEDLAAVARKLARSEPIDPGLLRRNLAISGLGVAVAAPGWLAIGAVLLELTGPCNPCQRMDEALGEGGRRAMAGKGGLTARVLRGGQLRVGDAVALLTANPLLDS